MTGTRPAAFLDRDGTVIADANYLASPEGIELLPGAADAIARLNRAGWPVVLVTNQSGIGRGFYSTDDFLAVQARLEALLSTHEARLTATYHCPHNPDDGAPCECRKPATGLYRLAAREHDLDLARSVYVGDRLSDVNPAETFGGTGYLISNAAGSSDGAYRVVPSLAAAVEDLLKGSG